MSETTDLLRRAAELLRKLDHEEIDASDTAASLLALADQMERAEPAGIVLTAALNAMPDDLLRKLVAERGCVLVPEAPEGCTPTDAKVLRLANHAFAQEMHELIDLLREFAPEGEIACDECGGDDAECPANCMVRRARARIKAYDYAADPRQQALDRMAENAQELGRYGKEKGDE